MRVVIKRKNLVVTQPLMQYVDRSIVRPLRRLTAGAGELPILDIEIGRLKVGQRKGEIYTVVATYTAGGRKIRAEERQTDVRAACDLMRDKLLREVKKEKGKIVAKGLRRARRAKKDIRLDPAARMYRKGRIRDEGY